MYSHKLRSFLTYSFGVALSLTFALVIPAIAGSLTKPFFDVDGDGIADVSVFRRTDQNWYVKKSLGGFDYVRWGVETDNLVPGDYDGDGKTDIAIHRKLVAFPETGTWWIIGSQNSNYYATRWASNNIGEFDTPVPADYDGDGKTDLAYYRQTDVLGQSGTFIILPSSTNIGYSVTWGNPSLGDRAVPADYDGDGKADIAIYRNGEWWILQSSDGSISVERFGIGSDKIVRGDFDGDGKADLAVWRPANGTWYWRSSETGTVHSIPFGINSDKPVADDFDGDGKTDIAVFRPSNGVWYILCSATGTLEYHHFGLDSDTPIQNVFVR